jgi:hypothetical protein
MNNPNRDVWLARMQGIKIVKLKAKNTARGLGQETPFKPNPRPSIKNAILHNTIYTMLEGTLFSTLQCRIRRGYYVSWHVNAGTRSTV